MDKIIDKIRKLHAHAESAAQIGNEHEAAAFGDMYDEYMASEEL